MDLKPELPDWETLIARAISGELSPEETATLELLCRRDPLILEALTQQTLTHRLLFTALQDPEGTRFAAEIGLRLHQEREHGQPASTSPPPSLESKVAKVIQFKQLRRQLLKLAAMLLVALGALWMVPGDSATARIERIEALSSAETFSAGQEISAGKWVSFESGLMALRFGCGAEVLVEGPATLEIRDAWHGYIQKGRIVANVGRRARGFTLEGPGGRLVDLGTKFAVSVEDGKGMELHVLEGLVEATPEGQKDPLRITKNGAVRLGSGRATAIASADSGAFVTALPPKSWRSPRWVHWGFEEHGPHFLNKGRGLASNADLELRTPETQPQQPLIPGPFGQALQLNGDGTFADSPFKGIGGTDPRSVAFWIKVPSDFKTAEGYAILSWGSRIQNGAAWQISINPTETEGPLGRLRVGVHNAPVVGTRDLRDDQWHHCAVVLYGGTGVDISTHILLYVDGNLESAARKAVMPVHTDTDSPSAHGIWLGRNLSKAGPSPVPSANQRFQGPSFRGAIDEVYIFDSAIGQEQILHLMQTNDPR